MKPSRRAVALLIGLVLTTPVLNSAEEPVESDTDRWIPVPSRVGDLTFPTLLVLGFTPRPGNPVGAGNWAIEFNYSVANAFQASENFEDWLHRRGGDRRRHTIDDADRIIDEFSDSQFLIDGEFGLADFGLHLSYSILLD